MANFQGAEEQQLRGVVATLRAECGPDARGVYKFRAIIKTVAAQLRSLSDSPVRTISDIGSIKEPMPADLRGLHARFPPVHFFLAICGLRVVSGHIQRDPLVFTIARGGAVADMLEELAETDGSSPPELRGHAAARRGRRPSSSGPAGPLQVTEKDIEAWFELLLADEARLDELGPPPPDAAGAAEYRQKASAARRSFAFPAAMAQRFPALRLYRGESDEELYAVLCSLAVMTAALRAHAAATDSEAAEDSVGRAAVGLVTRAQTRGPLLLGESGAVLPLSLLQLERWGGDLRAHAPSAGALAASYLALVLHNLVKIDKVVQPLRSAAAYARDHQLPGSPARTSATPPDSELLSRWLSSERGAKAAGIGRLSPHYRSLLIAGFRAGFDAAQAVLGEAPPAAALGIARFLRDHGSRAASWFLDHYLLVAAGRLGAPTLGPAGGKQGFVSSL